MKTSNLGFALGFALSLPVMLPVIVLAFVAVCYVALGWFAVFGS